MDVLIDIFEPYLPFISFLTFIIINSALIFRRVNWFLIILANVLVTLVMNFLGLGDYDFITIVLSSIIDILETIIKGLTSSILGLFEGLIDWLNPFR